VHPICNKLEWEEKKGRRKIGMINGVTKKKKRKKEVKIK